jgi:hypothetical protein
MPSWPFLALLAELLAMKASQVLIIATLRSDFFGQLQLHPSGLHGWAGDNADLVRRESGQRGWKLLHGGACIHGPLRCRAAFRRCIDPVDGFTSSGLRPWCPSPPGSLLGATAARKPGG